MQSEPVFPTINDTLIEARRRGWKLCNLFQLEDGQFRANFIVRETGCGFGTAIDPGAALANAFAAAAEFDGDGGDLI